MGGHSWGGNLLLHLLATHHERVAGALVVDPLGGVGDGGFPAFDAEMVRRTPPEEVERAAMLDQRLMHGIATEAEAMESLRIFWPACIFRPPTAHQSFPSSGSTPHPPVRRSSPLWPSFPGWPTDLRVPRCQRFLCMELPVRCL